MIHDDIHVRPGAKLPLPVCNGGQGGNDEEGASDPHTENLVQKGDGLDGLSQPHFICQYTVFSRNKNKDCVREQETAEGSLCSAIILKYRKYITVKLVSTIIITINVLINVLCSILRHKLVVKV